MATKHRIVSRLFALLMAIIIGASTVAPGLADMPPVPSQLPPPDDGAQRAYHDQTGKLRFLAAQPGQVIAIPGAQEATTVEDRAMAALSLYAQEFGLTDPVQELQVMEAPASTGGPAFLRYQQVYQGIPVLAGEMIVGTDEAGNLLSMSGEVSPTPSLSVTPDLTAEQARTTALEAVAKWYELTPADLTVTEPELWIYDERLLLPSTRPAELVWRMDVPAADLQPIDELVLVNAHTGGISLHFNQIDTALSLATYTANSGSSLPGSLLCVQTQPNCTNGSDLHADKAHLYANQTYSFYNTNHGRDGIDNAGGPIISTVHYCRPPSSPQDPGECPYGNAFWSGAALQMVYGDKYGFPFADDVVAHELTHGVTDLESGLFYYYQSGAINESFSDVWGEFVDQTNGAGNDSAAVKWKMGEDITGLGAIRDMKNPPANGDPDKMTSPLYIKTAFDNGGVHTNSGVNNKAVYLMTDGGTFNGKTVTGLGIPKVAAIYYDVQTNRLTSGSDYADLYFALSQACASLVGGALGITNDDCQAVRDAADAVQMNLQPAANFNPEAALCPANMALGNILFFDDLETVTPNWTFGAVSGSSTWSRTTDYAASGLFELYSSHVNFANSFAAMSADEPTLPANAFLHFKHSFGFEDSGAAFWDGGILEYSTNGGSNWLDAKPLFSDGKNYGGKIATAGTFGNPLAGRDAFVADSHGYVSSRYNLNTLTGQNVRFRWRFGSDFVGGDLNWLVDDVRIYTCTGVPGIPSLLTPAANSLTTDYTPTLDWADSTPGLDHYQIQVDDNVAFSPAPLIVDQTTTSSTFTISTPLNPASTYYWRIRAFNATGQFSDWSPIRILYTAVVPPAANFPANNSPVPTTRPLFDWANVAGATSYSLQISTSQTFATFVLNLNMSASAYAMPTDLPRGTLLFWRVRANGAHGSGDWSRVRHFDSANPPGVPMLVAPANAAIVTPPPVLDWNDSSPAADTYEIQISTDENFATLLGRGFSGQSNQSSYVPSGAFGSNTTYHWRVRAVNAGGQFSEWSAARNFKTP